MELVIRMAITVFFAVIAYYDYKYAKIKNTHLLFIFPIGLAICYLSGHFLLSLIVALVVCLFSFLIHLLGWRLKKVGGGDLKIMSLLPFLFNPASTNLYHPMAICYVVMLSGIIAMPFLFIYRKMSNRNSEIPLNGIPFGVPLGIASIIGIWLF